MGTVISNCKGLPSSFKNKQVKFDETRITLSTKFASKKESPVMTISYVPEKNENVPLITYGRILKTSWVTHQRRNILRCRHGNELLKDYSVTPHLVRQLFVRNIQGPGPIDECRPGKRHQRVIDLEGGGNVGKRQKKATCMYKKSFAASVKSLFVQSTYNTFLCRL